MSRKVLVLLAIFTVFLSTGAGWWNSNWENKKAVTVTEQSGSAIDNYPVRFTVDIGSASYKSIRLVNESSGNELDFGLKKYSSGEYNVSTKINLGSGNTIENLSVYYNNTGASAANKSWKEAAYNLYDSFEDGNFNTSKWSWTEKDTGGGYSSTYTETGGYLSVKIDGSVTGDRGTSTVTSKRSFSSNVKLESKAEFRYGYCGRSVLGYVESAPAWDSRFRDGAHEIINAGDGGDGDDPKMLTRDSSGDSSNYGPSVKYGPGIKHEWGIFRNGSQNRHFTVNNNTDSDYWSTESDFTTNNLPVSLGVTSWCTQSTNDFEVRAYDIGVKKRIQPEPSVNIGTEEGNTMTVSLSWNDESNGENGFNIYTNASGNYQNIGSVGENTESFSYSGQELSAGQYTCFNITSYNSYGESTPLHGCDTL